MKITTKESQLETATFRRRKTLSRWIFVQNTKLKLDPILLWNFQRNFTRDSILSILIGYSIFFNQS